MKFRIDVRGAMKDPLHLVWILVYVSAAMLLLGPLQSLLLRAAGWGNPAAPVFHAIPPAQPAVLAGGIEVAEGILQFTGNTARGIWSGQVTSALIALLFSYMIGPALLVWGLRARARYRTHIRVWGGVPAIVTALMLGGFALSTVVPSPLYAIVGTRAHEAMIRTNKGSETLDAFSVDLYMMARKAQVRYFRSGNARGEGHTWLQQDKRSARTLQMAELLDPSQRALCTDSASVTIEGKHFVLHVERPDSITLCGSVPCDAPEWSQQLSSASPHEVSMTVGVTPLQVNMMLLEK